MDKNNCYIKINKQNKINKWDKWNQLNYNIQNNMNV